MSTSSPAAAPADDRRVFRKTEAGRQALAAAHASLALRDRQILLLCTGERDLRALSEVFGPATLLDVQRLVAAGLIEATAPIEWPEPDAPFWPTLPPLDFAAERSANQSGFGAGATGEEVLSAARAQAAVLLAEIGGDEAERQMAAGAEEALHFITRALALAVRSWGDAPARRWAEHIAALMPRAAIAQLVEGLVEEGSATTLVAVLYERLVSDSISGPETGAPGGG